MKIIGICITYNKTTNKCLFKVLSGSTPLILIIIYHLSILYISVVFNIITYFIYLPPLFKNVFLVTHNFSITYQKSFNSNFYIRYTYQSFILFIDRSPMHGIVHKNAHELFKSRPVF